MVCLRNPHPQLVVQGRLVALKGDLPAPLADALAAIPGVPVAVHGMSWALRVGPDRAHSLMRVAERHGVEMSDAARHALAALCSERGLSEPVVEVTTRDGAWLSLMEDWLSLAFEELRAVPGGRARPAAARVEVPLTRSTADAIARTVASHRLRLSPAAELALEEIASTGTAPPGHEEAPRWIARIEVDRSGSAPGMRITTRWGDPPPQLAELDSLVARAADRVAPLTPGNLQLLGQVLAGEPEASAAPAIEKALDWLARNPAASVVPPAELDLLDEPEGARLSVEAIWDEGPAGAFAEQEAALLRRSSSDRAHLPAEAWPSHALARFIRLHGVACTPAVASLVADAPAADLDARRLIALSSAADADLTVAGLGGELMPFQRAGVAYALERRRVFLADEQGLGKTIQALATLEADQAYPAVVVCPASLKLNWLREVRGWLPQRVARDIAGRAPQRFEAADVFVINYEIVEAHLESLRMLAPQALILDEAHYVKNSKAARTRAVLELAGGLGPDALRLALTGTPIVNRPAELAPQLRALDRLREYGSASSFRHGYASETARRRLHQRLRSSCYLRRRKADVLEQLPDKRRAVIAVPLDDEADYRRAERDFLQWLRDELGEEGRDRLPAGARVQAIVRMTALRRLAARGKLAAALAWLEDFLESEERLVVFAHHRDIQRAVIERFPGCARIVAADTPALRDENVERFQADDGPQLCVCSIEVAAHGFTLTKAANVAFLELAWTPAKHDQAEDRVHRIGQRSAVTAWYLLAAGTIDERIAALLEAKREVVDSLTDGGRGGGESLATAILADYAASAHGSD